jgi:hypothetical protein
MFAACGIIPAFKMAKRGRKPKERKGYFYESEEDAIVRFIQENDELEKNKIFNEVLYPALTKMIESIIRRYKLFIPDEDFDQNFNDTISYLLTKIENFKPIITGYDLIEEQDIDDFSKFVEMSEDEFKLKSRNASEDDPEFIFVYLGENKKTMESIYKFYKRETHNYKAYSYCGTVCKNYLMFKSTQYAKKRKRDLSYEYMAEELANSYRYYIDEPHPSEISEKLVGGIANEIEDMIFNNTNLNEDEIKVGRALISLLRNWEEVLPDGGSNKLQKSSVLYYLREETMMSTKEVRDNMKKYKTAYKLVKKNILD